MQSIFSSAARRHTLGESRKRRPPRGWAKNALHYIQLYHGNASLLAESLEVIQQPASVILAALEPPIADEVTNEDLAEVAA